MLWPCGWFYWRVNLHPGRKNESLQPLAAFGLNKNMQKGRCGIGRFFRQFAKAEKNKQFKSTFLYFCPSHFYQNHQSTQTDSTFFVTLQVKLVFRCTSWSIISTDLITRIFRCLDVGYLLTASIMIDRGSPFLYWPTLHGLGNKINESVNKHKAVVIYSSTLSVFWRRSIRQPDGLPSRLEGGTALQPARKRVTSCAISRMRLLYRKQHKVLQSR